MKRSSSATAGLDNEADQALQAAYVSLAPRLCKEFARLSASGVKVAPYDSLDLVHDFFIDRWEAVHAGHEPSRGPLEPYAARSFRRYVIRVVAREGRDRSREIAYALHEPKVESETRPSSYDLQAIRSAVDRLPPRQRSVLCTFLDSGSERVAARSENVTRYHARRLLEEAVVNVATRVGAHPAYDREAWLMTVRFLREDAPLGALARSYGRTVDEVRSIQRDVLGTLLASLRSHITGNDMTIEALVSPASSGMDVEGPGSLLERFCNDSENEAIREAIAERRDEILLYLCKRRAPHLSPLVYESLYEALGGREDENPLDTREAEERAERRRVLGELFSDLLVPAHPGGAGALRAALNPLPQAEKLVREHLRGEPDTIGAEESGLILARAGLRPAHAAQMLSGLSLLFDRIHRRISEHGPIRLKASGELVGEDEQNREAALRAARDSASLPDTHARLFLGWLLETVDRAPLLVAGYSATLDDDETITFLPTQEVIETWQYGQLWGPPQGDWSGDGAAGRVPYRRSGASREDVPSESSGSTEQR